MTCSAHQALPTYRTCCASIAVVEAADEQQKQLKAPADGMLTRLFNSAPACPP